MKKATSDNLLSFNNFKWLLNWCAKSPKNFMIAVFWVLFFSIAFTLYNHRDFLEKVALNNLFAPMINPKLFKSAAERLAIRTGANLISIQTVNVSSDEKNIDFFQIDNHEIDAKEGKNDTLFSPTSDSQNRKIIRLIRKERFCTPFSTTDSIVPPIEAANAGIVELCYISVPAYYDSEFLGILTIGFKQIPFNQDQVLNELLSASNKILD